MPVPAPVAHPAIAADAHRVPAPFRTLAVRSDEPGHADRARAPYGRVHVVHAPFLDAGARAALARHAYARMQVGEAFDVDYAPTTPAGVAGLAGLVELAAGPEPGAAIVTPVAQALRLTGVLGDALPPYLRSVATRIDFLASRGAGFHNDVARHWPRCLFWVLALDATDVEFVMPHAGVRVPVTPGDLLVFDPVMAHGLCRPADAGRAEPAHFDVQDDASRQLFLTGELLLDDARWAALGAPWEPVEAHAARAALDLRVAQFDDRGGTVQRVHALRGCMQR